MTEINNQSHLKVTPSNKYTDSLVNMEQIIEAERKKKKLIKNSIIAGVAFIFIFALYSKYQEGAEERAREAREAERKAKIEEERRKKNIHRVTTTIFIEDRLHNIKTNLITSMNKESIDTTKETFYINKFTKLFDKEGEKLISNIEEICESEAGKETEVIDICIENNEKAAEKRIQGMRKDLIADIEKSILDLKFLERNSKLQKIIDTITSKLQNEKNILKTYTSQLDSYIINGKNPPASLKMNIDDTNYNIDNYQHHINQYKNMKLSEKLEIVEP
ncbi:MAG: hypothetical protein FK731_09595, partial [Asgard group archaeon]|nr:hypothetical protein [Asgard group archaeon]